MPESSALTSSEKTNDIFNPSLVFPVSIVALTALSLGYDAGVMSGALAPISEHYKLNTWEQGLMIGSLNICAAPGALLGSYVADLHGRIPATVCTAAVLILGPLIVALSTSFTLLMAGRVITGLGVGFAFVIPPLYAAELAPPALRGRLVTATEVLINAGLVLGYLSAILLHVRGVPASMGWRLVTGFAALPPALVLGFCAGLPESPRWLAKQGRWEDVDAILRQVFGDTKEFTTMKQSISEYILEEENQASWRELLCPTPVIRRMLTVGLGIAFFQQACGSEAIVYYSPSILEQYGIENAARQNQDTIFIGLAKLVGAIAGGPFLDHVGRRPGLLVSTAGCSLAIVSLAMCLQIGGVHNVALLLLCIFMFVFELGLAPGAFVLGTESYPVAIRAKALAMGMFTTRILAGLISAALPVMIEAWTLEVALWIFGSVAFLGFVWALFCVPETKGLPLESVAKIFGDGVEESRRHELDYGSIVS